MTKLDDEARQDLMLGGTAILKDGKRVPPQEFFIQPSTVTDEMVERAWAKIVGDGWPYAVKTINKSDLRAALIAALATSTK